jgi:hypothetical protein
VEPKGLAKSSGITDSTLMTVVNFTLNDEAGRVEKLDGIETKFYCLEKYDVIASVSIFAIEVFRGKCEVFSFILILPYMEMTEFLPRHSICESKLQRLLKEHMILPLKEMVIVPVNCCYLGHMFYLGHRSYLYPE